MRFYAEYKQLINTICYRKLRLPQNFSFCDSPLGVEVSKGQLSVLELTVGLGVFLIGGEGADHGDLVAL